MPIAVVILDDKLPAILSEDCGESLLDSLNALDLPRELVDIEDAVSWLEDQPPPSGWFETLEQAKAFMLAVNRERDAKYLKAVMATLDMSTIQLSAALNMSDPNKDGSPIRKILAAKTALSKPVRRLLSYILKYGPLSEEIEGKIIAPIGDEWKKIKRSELRRYKVAGR